MCTRSISIGFVCCFYGCYCYLLLVLLLLLLGRHFYTRAWSLSNTCALFYVFRCLPYVRFCCCSCCCYCCCWCCCPLLWPYEIKTVRYAQAACRSAGSVCVCETMCNCVCIYLRTAVVVSNPRKCK